MWRVQAQRAPAQQLVDRFARVYTPLVFTLALGVMLIGLLADLMHGADVGVGQPRGRSRLAEKTLARRRIVLELLRARTRGPAPLFSVPP